MDLKSFEYYNENYDLYLTYKNAFSPETDMLHDHAHRTYEIFYLREGQRNFFINNKLYFIKRNSIVLISPELQHRTVGEYPTYYSTFIINFNFHLLPKYLSSQKDVTSLLEHDFTIFELDETAEAFLEAVILQISQEISGKKCGFHLAVFSLVTSFISQLVRSYNNGNLEHTPVSLTPNQHTIHAVIEYISAHFDSDLSLEFLAGKFFISPWHLSRTFKIVTGVTIHQYISRIRIYNAKNILDNHRKTKLSTIAARCGYKSESSFIRAFKHQFGITPHQYRKRKVITPREKLDEAPDTFLVF